MPSVKNIIIPGVTGLPISLDIFYDDVPVKKPVVIYAHGFNGFKDWGNFDLIAAQFATAGFVFLKFNFSHNGTSPENPEEFTNLEAFAVNNYTKQMADLKLIIDWVCDLQNIYQRVIDSDHIYLIGHSMGGGISILQAATDSRVKKLITWAGISECNTPWGGWSSEKIQEWKETGVAHYSNSRTGQQMPMYYQLYEDFIQNSERLDIPKAIGQLNIPVLICHGRSDTAVPVEKAFVLKKLQPLAQLFITDSDHVFGRKHPWTSNELPQEMQDVVQASLQFLNQ